MLSEPILRHPDMAKHFIIMTDASGYAIGAVLGQLDDHGNDYAIAYVSWGPTNHEKHHTVVELEPLETVLQLIDFEHISMDMKRRY